MNWRRLIGMIGGAIAIAFAGWSFLGTLVGVTPKVRPFQHCQGWCECGLCVGKLQVGRYLFGIEAVSLVGPPPGRERGVSYKPNGYLRHGETIIMLKPEHHYLANVGIEIWVTKESATQNTDSLLQNNALLYIPKKVYYVKELPYTGAGEIIYMNINFVDSGDYRLIVKTVAPGEGSGREYMGSFLMRVRSEAEELRMNLIVVGAGAIVSGVIWVWWFALRRRNNAKIV